MRDEEPRSRRSPDRDVNDRELRRGAGARFDKWPAENNYRPAARLLENALACRSPRNRHDTAVMRHARSHKVKKLPTSIDR